MSPGFLFCAAIACEGGPRSEPVNYLLVSSLLTMLTRLICRSTSIAGMDCFYINLGSAAQCKLNIERNFAAYKMPGWTLTRQADGEGVLPQRLIPNLELADSRGILESPAK